MEHVHRSLYDSAFEGDERAVRGFLDEGADVNKLGGVYGNPLQAAAYKGHQDIVKLLLENGANINIQGGECGSALQAATIMKRTDLVKLLLEAGADVNFQGGKYGSALHAAAFKGKRDILELLLDAGADINAKSGPDGSAIQVAAEGGHGNAVELLLEKGADINTLGGKFGSVLQAAIVMCSNDLVKLLLKANTDVNIQGGKFGSALRAAVVMGNEDILKLLLEAGAEVDIEGGSELREAVAKGKEGIVKLLLDAHFSRSSDMSLQGSAAPAGDALGTPQNMREINKTYPIMSSNPACKIFEDVRKMILVFLDHTGVDWRSLNLFLRRSDYDLPKPTVLIISLTEVSRGVKELFRKGILPKTLNCEWLVGDVCRSVGMEGRNSGFFEVPNLGVSVGVRNGKTGSGTIGGYIKLEGVSDEIYALTCHHVISSSHDPIAISQEVLLLEHPSLEDRSAMVQKFDMKLAAAELRLIDLRNLGKETRHQEWRVSYLRQNKMFADEVLARDCHIGSVSYSSGLITAGWPNGRSTGGHQHQYCLDWAICAVKSGRGARNSCPRPRTDQVVPKFNDKIRVTDLYERSGDIQSLSALEVTKMGRTTGYTTGKINGVMSSVSFTNHTYRTTELCVVGDRGVPFADEGDSGAWVLNEHDSVIGMVFAGDVPNRICTYITPITYLFDSIEKVTGRKPSIYTG